MCRYCMHYFLIVFPILVSRQHPGQYEYYKNYDDLEASFFWVLMELHVYNLITVLIIEHRSMYFLQSHFRQGHFLCEDESCLAKKFVVFQSEAEMKVLKQSQLFIMNLFAAPRSLQSFIITCWGHISH